MEQFNSFFENGFWSALITSALLALVAILLIRVSNRAFKRIIARNPGNTTALTYTRRIISVTVGALAAMGIFMQVTPLQSVARSLLASSGVIAVILGFAAQEAMGNLVGGFFISIFKPFALGDRITLREKNIVGFVEDISLRHTVIRTFENTRVIVPNSVMNNAIVENAQYQEQKVCQFLDVGVSYDTDVDQAMGIINDLVQRHPSFLDNRSPQEVADGAPAVVTRLIDFGESALKLRTPVWAKDAGTAYAMLCDLRLQIKKTFDQQGIEIPFPYRTVVLKGREGEER